ncbi:MAG TPA: D-2-hydroxyacid dehydrogenase [Chloroflexota bacterium]|nr:D-2-hydroxyacid dehydrogenase [Chloroflexota bacterium]
MPPPEAGPFKFVFLPPQGDRNRQLAAQVADEAPDAQVVVAETEEDALREIADARAAFGTLSPALLRAAGRLAWVQAPAAAPPAGYYFPELIAHPAVVTNLRGIFNDRIPAHIMAYVLSFARGLHIYARQQRESLWRPHGEASVVYLPRATALIVGVGHIGAETARLCAAFGMRVVGVDARRQDVPSGVTAVHPPEALDSLLPEADFVILTVPHTPSTEGLFDAARFAHMKRSAFFINIGRGMTTRLDALDQALRAGTIAGAGIDVYEVEPLPKEHPLWTAPNAILTPHVADRGPDLDPARGALIAENARRFGAGEALLNVVDKASWF